MKTTVDSKTLEYGFSMICVGVPSFHGIRGQSYTNFLASTVNQIGQVPLQYAHRPQSHPIQALAP